jgi:hypothetical protein
MFRQIIELPIMDEETYEKSLILYVNLGEPRQIAGEYFIPIIYFSTKIVMARNTKTSFVKVKIIEYF